MFFVNILLEFSVGFAILDSMTFQGVFIQKIVQRNFPTAALVCSSSSISCP